MYRIDTEDVSVAHLGAIKTQPTSRQLELLGTIDVLLAPIGGGDMMNADQAVKLINAIEPRVIIPIGHQCDTAPSADTAEQFLKAIGLKADTEENKVIIKKKDLPQDNMRVVVITKES
jgi:L-ascorbate metabolism protein UlaG (beta-lactamase superfamily)